MTLSWVEAERLWVVEGADRREVGTALVSDPPRGTAALAVHDAAAGTWLTVPVGALAALRSVLAAGLELSALFGESDLEPAVAVYAIPARRPSVPTITIVDGTVAGAWVAPVGLAQLDLIADGGLVEGGTYGAPPSIDFDLEFDVEAAPAEAAAPPDAPPAAEPPGLRPEPAIERTPHMEAPDPLPQRDASFTVRVHTDTATMRAEEQGEHIVIEAPPDVDELELGVLLTASPGLEVDAPFFQDLTIRRHEPDGEGVTFTVRVTGDPTTDEVGLTAELFHRGRPSGHVVRRWKGGVAQRLGVEIPAAAVHSDAIAPDLTLVISAPVPDGINYNCTVLPSRLPGLAEAQTVSWALPALADRFVQGTLASFVDRTVEPDRRRRRLHSAGLQFFNALPELYRDALWALLDQQELAPDGRVRTLFIRSDEPLLPWELMIPTRMVDGVADDRPLPLGVEVALGRWVRSDTTPPPQRLRVDKSLLVAAVNSKPGRSLDSTDEERVLHTLYAGTRTPSATLGSLDAYLGEHSAAVLHFVCHGATQDFDDAIYLDEDEACTSGEVRVTPGFASACRRDRPLVFLNACDAGQMAAAVGGGAGFPRVFTDLGARAVIAPLWPVAQVVAARAAVQLYEAAAVAEPPRTLADLLRDVRRRAYEEEPFEDSYASYCFFGDPCARLERCVADA